MRHGRKSASKRFDGHKAAVAVDTDGQLITAVDVLAGNAPDATGRAGVGGAERAGHRLRRSGRPTGTAPTAMARRGRRSPTPAGCCTPRCRPCPTRDGFPKTAFRIDLPDGGRPPAPVPAGRPRPTLQPHRPGCSVFVFAAATCAACPLQAQCLKAPPGAGRRLGRTIFAPPPGGAAPGRPRLPGQPRLRRGPSSPPGRRAPPGPPRPPRDPAGPLRRPHQDAVPTAPGGHRREPDPAGHADPARLAPLALAVAALAWLSRPANGPSTVVRTARSHGRPAATPYALPRRHATDTLSGRISSASGRAG